MEKKLIFNIEVEHLSLMVFGFAALFLGIILILFSVDTTNLNTGTYTESQFVTSINKTLLIGWFTFILIMIFFGINLIRYVVRRLKYAIEMDNAHVEVGEIQFKDETPYLHEIITPNVFSQPTLITAKMIEVAQLYLQKHDNQIDVNDLISTRNSLTASTTEGQKYNLMIKNNELLMVFAIIKVLQCRLLNL
jgi:hypothetical protein